MNIAIVTLDAFNELDSFVSYGILNRMKSKGWKAYITSPTANVERYVTNSVGRVLASA
jgi:hypothetical protein